MQRARRPLFSPEHEAFRDQVRRWCEREIAPAHAQWADSHRVPREVWRQAGETGLLCCWLPEADGGAGGDLLFDFIVCEELGRVGATGPGFPLHSVIVTPYIAHHGTPSLKQRVLPGMASGERVGAIAMTEPGTGSDLAGIRTRAERDGDHWVIHGQKTFITNGQNADVIVVACKTDPERGAKGVSLFVVTADMPGFSRGRNLHKIGQHAQDTAELFFDGVRVPHDHLLGELNMGFRYLMQELAQERLLVSVQCQARAEAAFEWTQRYVHERKAFGQRVADFQNTRFQLAGLWAELQAGRAYCDQLIGQHLAGELDAVGASAGKLWHSELLGRLTDQCLQLHGGYGYMAEYPIAQAYVDARIERIYAGTSEIMKEIIARAVCDGPLP
ncbi:acyl-CoA dehydrogenase family protein [Hydrogenophaga electricum]|uniref:Acyl-CoA dehydrogenase n=1 Tax=Hydrogenophaga electricum TaxID=1230953 RepID=A0ABQ6C395_9BURK|nr:acyl-CoA dehydrogenase family protein [Hydrogenophaga electricum]GLS14355.1 acyl-CoA dehydrogenase [Hydrogenophaga electricum]